MLKKYVIYISMYNSMQEKNQINISNKSIYTYNHICISIINNILFTLPYKVESFQGTVQPKMVTICPLRFLDR